MCSRAVADVRFCPGNCGEAGRTTPESYYYHSSAIALTHAQCSYVEGIFQNKNGGKLDSVLVQIAAVKHVTCSDFFTWGQKRITPES